MSRLVPKLIALLVAFSSTVLIAGTALAAPDPETQKRGQILFEQSEGAYKEGRFDEAIAMLKEAYRLTPDPVVFYNLGRAYEAKGDLREAASAYDRYLAEVKDIPDRATIEAKSNALKAELQKREQAAQKQDPIVPVKPVEPVEPETTASASPIPWVVAGFGAAGLVAGGVVGALALGKNGDAESAPSQVDAAELRASAEDLALVSTVTMAVSGAVLAAGAIWGIVDIVNVSSAKSDDAPGASALRVRVGPTGASLSLEF